jgi:4-hydroxy-tetrahydrodipicolinate reductase
MSEMRLIVAGAGGRMGRALTRVIAETPGAVLTGALEAPGSELLGKDAGVLAGLPPNGVLLSADLWSLSANADGILDFTVPRATIANVAIAAQRGLVHVIGTTGLSVSERHDPRHRRQVRQYEPRDQSAGSTGQARRAIAG